MGREGGARSCRACAHDRVATTLNSSGQPNPQPFPTAPALPSGRSAAHGCPTWGHGSRLLRGSRGALGAGTHAARRTDVQASPRCAGLQRRLDRHRCAMPCCITGLMSSQLIQSTIHDAMAVSAPPELRHKFIPGTSFAVDLFRRPVPGVTAYFLTHAHSGAAAGLLGGACAPLAPVQACGARRACCARCAATAAREAALYTPKTLVRGL